MITTGLLNAAAIVIDPASGDLLIAENGIDTPDDRLEAFSADELDRIAADDIGGEAEDFGFPNPTSPTGRARWSVTAGSRR